MVHYVYVKYQHAIKMSLSMRKIWLQKWQITQSQT